MMIYVAVMSMFATSATCIATSAIVGYARTSGGEDAAARAGATYGSLSVAMVAISAFLMLFSGTLSGIIVGPALLIYGCCLAVGVTEDIETCVRRRWES